MGDSADRLTLPRRQDMPSRDLSHQESTPKLAKMKIPEGLPSNPLPTWTTLPLGAKLPMLPAPKGAVVLHTTNIGEKIHKSSHELDFDLTDPYSILMSNCYKPLNDPHLKTHLNAPRIRQRLNRGGFTTEGGKVICNLKEFNEYRQYLRKLKLALDKATEGEKTEKIPKLKRRKHGQLANLTRAREIKVKEIKERLAQQHEEDRERYLRLKSEEEERRKRLRADQLNRLTDREKLLREKENNRQVTIRRKEIDDKRRKMRLLRTWLNQDYQRKIQAELRRKEKENDRQRKLEESWELRKKLQQSKLDEDQRRRDQEEEHKRRRIEEREHQLNLKLQRQQEMFLMMTKKRREEREELEKIYMSKFTSKTERRRIVSAERQRTRKVLKKKMRGHKMRPCSNWDIEKSILQCLSEDDCSKGRSYSDGEQKAQDQRKESFIKLMDDHKEISLENRIQSSIENLSLTDFRGATFNQDIIQAADKKSSETAIVSRLGSEHQRSSSEDSTSQEDIEKTAKNIVDMSLFITTKVIYPAYLRYLKEDHPDAANDFLHSTGQQSPDILDLRETGPCSCCTSPEHTQCSDEDIPFVKEKSSRSVRFSIMNETITIAEFDNLERLRQSQYNPEIYDADDESNICWQSSEDEDGTDDAISMETKDSLIFIHNLARPELSMNDVLSILGGLLTELQSGKLPNCDVQQLAYMAKTLLGHISAGTSPRDDSSKSTGDDRSSTSSLLSLSTIADQVVNQTIANVQKVLLEEETGQELTSTTDLAAFIVDKAVGLALGKMICISDPQKQTRPGSAPPRTPTSPIALHKAESSTSQFVMTVLERVVGEVNEEVKKETKKPSETSILVRNIIKNAADEMYSYKDSDCQTVDWNNAPVMKRSSQSVTGQFVRDTLYRVVQDMEPDEVNHINNISTKSSSSLFAESLVADTIQKCLTDLRNNQMSDREVFQIASAALKLKSSDQLSSNDRPLQHSVSLDQGMMLRSPITATSSVMIEALIRETLSCVKHALEQGTVTTADVLRLAKDADVSSGMPSLSTYTPINPKSDISVEAEKLVTQAINTALFEVRPGSARSNIFTDSDINKEAMKSDTSILAEHYVAKALAEAEQTIDFQPKSDVSLVAERAVQLAIEEAVQWHSNEDPANPVHSVLSLVAEALVKGAIDDILLNSQSLEELSGVIKPSIPDNADIENLIKDVLWKAAASTVTLDKINADEVISDNTQHCTIDATHYDDDDDDDSSEGEIAIHPVLGHEPVHIDHHIVEDALSILSVKKDQDILQHTEQMAARNSFADLMHPDISSIKRFSNESENEVCNKILSMSKHCISLPVQDSSSRITTNSGSQSAAEQSNTLFNKESDVDVITEGAEDVVGIVDIHQADSLEEIKSSVESKHVNSSAVHQTSSVRHNNISKSESTTRKKVTKSLSKNQSISSHIASSHTLNKSPSKKRSTETTSSPYTIAKTKPGKDRSLVQIPTPKTSQPSVSAIKKSTPSTSILRQTKSVSRETSKSAKTSSNSMTSQHSISSASQHKHRSMSAAKDIQNSTSNEYTTGHNSSETTLETSTNPANVDKNINHHNSKTRIPSTYCSVSDIASKDDHSVNKQSSVNIQQEECVPKLNLDDTKSLETKTKQTMCYGRNSPAAETVEEEDLPVRRRPSKKSPKSEHHLGKTRVDSLINSGPSSSSSTALIKMRESKPHSNIDTTPKASVTRQQVRELSTKLSKALSLSKKSSKMSTAAKISSKQSSHQMVDLTPRPSSGYRKSPTKQSIGSVTNSSREYIRQMSGSNICSNEDNFDERSSDSSSMSSLIRNPVTLTPKHSTTAVVLKSHSPDSQLEPALSDTSCTHSENAYDASKHDAVLNGLAPRGSTGSLPTTDSKQHLIRYQSRSQF